MRGGVKRKIYKSVLLGVLGYLMYLGKEVALSFLIAYIVMEISCFVQDFRNGKGAYDRNIRVYGIIAMIFSFVVCFASMKLTLFRGMGNSYNQMGIEAVASIDKFLFLWHAFLYNTLFAMIAFMIIPVVFPAMQRKSMNQEERRLYAFSVLSLVIILFVISYTISVREDFGKFGIRQHTRYYEPLFMLFMISYMAAIAKKEYETANKDLLVLVLISFFVLGIVKNIGIGSLVDSCMLKYYQYIQDNFGLKMVKVLQGAACLGIIAFFACRKKCERGMDILAIMIIFTICIINNVFAIYTFAKEYRITESELKEWEELNAYLKHEDKDVLLVSGYEARGADTFLRDHIYYVLQKEQGEFQGDANEYKDVRYILTYAYWGIKGAEEKMKCGEYTLYERTDMQNIEVTLLPCFPVSAGEKRIIRAEEGRFFSQSKVIDRRYRYVSGKEEGFLICGPYTVIQPGIYDVTVYYEYEGDSMEGEVIGKLDLKYSAEEPDRYTELRSGYTTAELSGIKVEETFENGEVRIFTTVPGVIFHKAEIRKSAE